MLVGYVALTAWVAFLHWRVASVVGGSSLAASDPPAHFTSGVMVYDYLRSGLGSDPFRFAESFYVRYPKVAIGHWPPVYYLVQAGWYSVFGATVWGAQALSAATAALLALVMFRRLRSAYGGGIAVAAALVLLATPFIQRTAWEVMSDLMTGLFVFLAIMAFSDLLDSPCRRWAGARFLLWSVLAILTKGTAWALAPFVVLAPLLANRRACYRAAWYWGSGLAIVVLASVFYLFMQWNQMGYPINFGYLLKRLLEGAVDWRERLKPLQPMLSLAPPLVLGLASFGLLDAFRTRWKEGEDSRGTTDALVAAAFILSQGLFSLVLPLTQEGRALLPSLAPAIMLMARALSRIERASSLQPASAIPLLIAGLTALSAGAIGIDRVDGYRAAAHAIPYPPEGVLMMVASDPAGEGAFIVERLVQDPRRAGIVLRADQSLAASNWMGTQFRPLFDSAEQVRDYIKALPVRYVVIDGSAEARQGQKLLEEAVRGDPADFRLITQVPVSSLTGIRRGEIRIYENPAARTRHPKVIRVRLGLDRGGRVLEYRLP